MLLPIAVVLFCAQARTIALGSLDLSRLTQDWGTLHRNQSVGGTPLTIDKVEYQDGIGTHANSDVIIDLHRKALRFQAMVGVDDETQGRGLVRFEVLLDGHRAADSGVMKGGDAAKAIEVNLAGVSKMELVAATAGDGIDYDHADWVNAQITLEADAPSPASVAPVQDPTMPIYMGHSDKPEINGARTVGCSPGMPLIFKIPVSGEGPLRYRARGLPQGLALSGQTGVIFGRVLSAGSYPVHVSVANPAGRDSRIITIVCGFHKLARTPPMGWNSWNVWGTTVTAEKIRAAADSFVREGLIDYGYRSVNIDDAWEGDRDADGNIQTNSKFGDMKALGDYVHSKGILLGIYSSPGPKTCAGYTASYQHEQQDADSYAKWGVDYLKYDWCSYGGIAPAHPTIADYQAPYILMRSCLDNCGRDIIFSLCQYGMGDSWNWAGKIGGNLWRTTGDIADNYQSMSNIAFSQDSAHARGSGPGHWNDPDMLVVGNLGWGAHPHPTGLSPNEQITHITMWSLLAAPLILGCDLTHLDPWTRALITNHDVIEVDQDPLGKQAQRVYSTPDGVEVWARPLWDGTIAVGLMNRERTRQKISVNWSRLGLEGSQPVRDLWMRKSLGVRAEGLSEVVPGHGAMLFKIGKPK